jgi:hypothetical protein
VRYQWVKPLVAIFYEFALGLDWGLPLVNPEAETIWVPSFTLAKLRQLGVLARNCNRLSPLIHELNRPEFDGIGTKIRRRTGPRLSTPAASQSIPS